MEKDFSKNMVYGNFCSMENDAFPIDCETLAALQSNTKKLAVIALISGCPRLILTGCELLANGYRSEGYVFMVNDENPLTGEILYHPYQSGGNFCRITETDETVTADGTEYPKAYTVRYLADSSSGSLPWSQFSTLKGITNLELYLLIDKTKTSLNNSLNFVLERLDKFSESVSKDITNEINTEASARKSADNAEASARKSADDGLSARINAEESARKSADDGLSARINAEESARKSADDGLSNRINANVESIKALSKQIEAINGAPKGIIVMWSGRPSTIPNGWALCDGNNETPDLRSRFIVGAWDDVDVNDDWYEPYGESNGLSSYVVKRTGGGESVRLTTSNLPEHNHSVSMGAAGLHWHYVYQNNGPHKVDYRSGSSNWCADEKYGGIEFENEMPKDGTYTIGFSDADGNHTHKITESSIGENKPFNILPPYYALCFIMKL